MNLSEGIPVGGDSSPLLTARREAAGAGAFESGRPGPAVFSHRRGPTGPPRHVTPGTFTITITITLLILTYYLLLKMT